MTGNPKSQELESVPLDPTKQYVANVVSHLPEEKVLQTFGERFLNTMNLRVLQTYSYSELANFVQERFAFFNEATQNNGAFRLQKKKGDSKTAIEVAYPDAAHLVITLESFFKEFKIRVRFKIHALISLQRDAKGALTSIAEPQPDEDRVVHIYFEVEGIEDDAMLAQLQKRLDGHLAAVQQAGQDNGAMLQTMMELKPAMAQVTGTAEPIEEWQNLLDWLKNFNFSFFGYTAFPTKKDGDGLKPIPGSGLGILSENYREKDFSQLLETLTASTWKCRNFESPFTFDTLKVQSPIKRFENLMRLSLKLPNAEGEIIEHVWVGLIKRSALQTKSSEVPIIHYKMKYIFERKNLLFDSHDYNQVIRIFSTMPQFELFRTPAEHLLGMANHLLSITDLSDIYCFSQYEQAKNQILLIVAIPSELFSRENTHKVVEYLKTQAPYTDFEVVELRGVSTCRLHIYFDLMGERTWTPNNAQLEEAIGELIKPWDERFRQYLMEQNSGGLSERLFKRYIPILPPHYRVRTHPKDAVRDILVLEKLAHGPEMRFDVTDFHLIGSDLKNLVSVLYLYSREKVDLIYTMPVLQNLGLYVVDQLTARIGDSNTTYGYVQSYRVQDQNKQPLDIERYKSLMAELLGAVFEGKTENDPLNALTILADLPWRSINVLQLYRNLYLQIGGPFTREKINSTLCHYAEHAWALVEYFETRFSPENKYGDLAYRREVLLPQKRKAFLNSLRKVDEVAEDTILRRMFGLMENTLRTNFFIPQDSTAISIKLESRKIEEMPVPVPFREMYVHDVGMEGTHLRFGTVARGGLRWSDRHDDFRTEILGLVKTQQTKNVVIVPVGSKGGFIVKKTLSSREEAAIESQKQYRKFIDALLDITDNMDSNRQARHPHHVLAHDELDPYLVVAADKGTATFSDTANEIAAEHQFWLDDAFASGGSVGYDHKKEGITARGAWECVKLHFREQGKDIQSEITTAIGIGDMSGDVFGNGMLLSQMLQLRAAFNHMHIFLDPNPDPAVSWKERKRLFELPRSTWEDYNATFISSGGGIFERKAKEIHLSPEVKAMLNVEVDVLSGEKLIRAILCMKTELLWFGGIGTYLKADSETNFQVGDQANDAVRINISECNASVIGEGANLGMTQLARIAFQKNGQLNTDAIDNSAGVNMSDYEVNIKILLQQMLEQKHLKSMEERNEILSQATDDVSDLVLANNRGQHRLLSMDHIRSMTQFRPFKHLIRYLVNEQGMDEKSEAIPDRDQLELIEETGEGLPRPVLAVLQAYVKMGIYDRLLESDLLDDPYLATIYRRYFPPTILERFEEHLDQHPLRREIIGTVLTNKIVNQAGVTFFQRMEQLSGKSVDEIALAYWIVDECLGGGPLRWDALYTEGLEQKVRYEALIAYENILQLLTQSWLQWSGKTFSFSMIDHYKPLFESLRASLVGSPTVQSTSEAWQTKGFSVEMSDTMALNSELQAALDVIYLHEQDGASIELAMKVMVQVNEAYGFSWLKQKMEVIELDSDWDQSHQDILLQSLEVHKMSLIRMLLKHHDEASMEAQAPQTWLSSIDKSLEGPLASYFQTLYQLQAGSPINLTTVAVCINRLNFLETLS